MVPLVRALILCFPWFLVLTSCRSPDDDRGWSRDPTRVEEVSPRISYTPGSAEPVVEQDEAYASIRIVKADVGFRTRPEIQLPPGYRLYDRGHYAVASPGEFYVFLGGPRGTANNVRIRWPGVEIYDVLHNDTHLPRRAGGDSTLVDVPVEAGSLRAAWPTLEIFSHLNEKNLPVRIEHNHEARRAGEYARTPWVGDQARAVLNFIFAARQILRDSGLHHHLADQRLGGFSLMGFETNNPLHGDFPPHFHWIYYFPDANGKPSGSAPGSQVPHFYLDSQGRIYENKLDVFGPEKKQSRLKPGQPMTFSDPAGNPVLSIEIRGDGGLNVGAAPADWTYQILPGEDDHFVQSVRVLKNAQPWILVAAEDDVDAGVLTVRIRPTGAEGEVLTEVYEYDPLTGLLKQHAGG